MKRKLLKTVLLITALTVHPVMAQESVHQFGDPEPITVVRHYQKAFRYDYHLELLDLVLSVTRDEFGPYRLQPVPEHGKEVAEARGVKFLDDGKIDVVFLSPSRERESKFRSVRIPLLKGLLGFRLLFIDQDHQSRFSSVASLSTLTEKFSAGFNPHWVDYGVYQANGFSLVDSVKYEDLFAMLEAGRFDFIPRGVNEVWQELAHFGKRHPSLQVEQRLALFYPYPVYFYVEKDNRRLHERLKLGLNILQEDGRFRQLLRRHYQQAVTRAKLDERQIFQLGNPLLPNNTRATSMEWWLQQNPLLP